MVRQLAAFTNVWRPCGAQGDRKNSESTALDLCHDVGNYFSVIF